MGTAYINRGVLFELSKYVESQIPRHNDLQFLTANNVFHFAMSPPIGLSPIAADRTDKRLTLPFSEEAHTKVKAQKMPIQTLIDLNSSTHETNKCQEKD